MDEVLKIVKDIKAGNIKPIYFLMGEEPYYIDKLSDYIEQNVLSEDEKGFNQTVLYGRDVSIEDVISTAKRYPMMAEHQVVKNFGMVLNGISGFTFNFIGSKLH